MTRPDPWLVALDVDGTILGHDGSLGDAVAAAVARVAAAGHTITLATGRSGATTIPVLEQLGIAPAALVCANGAVTLRRDPDAPTGYRRDHVETFDPTEVLLTIREHLVGAHFSVEDERGHYRCTTPFPDLTIGLDTEQVEFEALLHRPAARLVAQAPEHDMAQFLAIVEGMGLDRVSYAIGWTAWLDIVPHGVNKATAMERVRAELGIPRERVMAVADGRNDIELLTWAAVAGRGVAMGHALADVLAAANERTGRVDEDGLAHVLATL